MKTPEIIGYEFYRAYYADVPNQRVLYREQPLKPPLTAKEFEVLEFFLSRPRMALRPDDVTPLNEVWRDPHGRHPLNDYISKIRAKLGLEVNELFVTIRNVGYRLDGDVRPIPAIDREEAAALFRTVSWHFDQHTALSMRAAINIGLRALKLNPFGLPRLRTILAYCYIGLGHVGYCAELPEVTIPKAKRMAEVALRYDPDSAEAYGVFGLIALIYDYNWDRAESLFSKAIALNDKEVSTLLSYAHLLVCQGRPDEGLKHIRNAVRIVPIERIIHINLAWLYLLAGNVSRADEVIKDVVFRFPDFAPAHHIQGLVYHALGDYDQGLRSQSRSLELERLPAVLAARGHLYGLQGKRKLAMADLRQLSTLQHEKKIAYVSGYCEALIYAGLGETEESLSALEKAYKQRCDWLIHLGVERRWLALRNDARFKKLMAKVGIKYLSIISAQSAGSV